MARVRRGVFTCLGWQVALCDPVLQVTLRSCEISIKHLYIPLPVFYLCCITAYRCEPSWLLQRNTRPVYDTGRRNCSRHVTSPSACLEACLLTSHRCAGVTVSPVVDDDVIECRLYAHENQLRETRDVTGTDLYILHSHCYALGNGNKLSIDQGWKT